MWWLPWVLSEYRARTLLAAYGIGTENAGDLVHSADEAAAKAQAMGRPVALKVQSADIPHKTEAGAVALNPTDTNAVRAAYDRVLAAAKRYAPTAQIDGVWSSPWRRVGAKSSLASIAIRPGACC